MMWQRRPTKVSDDGAIVRIYATCGFCFTHNYICLSKSGQFQDLCVHNKVQNLKQKFFEFTNDRRTR